jgi:hypothetical protein
MITVAELAGWESFPFHIVFTIGRRDDDGFRLGAFKKHALERSQPRRVKMLDYVHHGSRIETAKPCVSVGIRGWPVPRRQR